MDLTTDTSDERAFLRMKLIKKIEDLTLEELYLNLHYQKKRGKK